MRKEAAASNRREREREREEMIEGWSLGVRDSHEL